MTNGTNKLIRNSTAEFLIFTGQAGEQSIEARYEDGPAPHAGTIGSWR